MSCERPYFDGGIEVGGTTHRPPAAEGSDRKRLAETVRERLEASALLPTASGPSRIDALAALAVLAEPCQCGETFRLIAQVCGEDGTDPDTWRAMVYPTPGEFALQAAKNLRRDSDEPCQECKALREAAGMWRDERNRAEAKLAEAEREVDQGNAMIHDLETKLADPTHATRVVRQQMKKWRRRALDAERQLEAVDKELRPWEPDPAGEVGCVGRVQTIRNLKADRRQLEQARAMAVNQMVEWIHFHEVAMADPFKAETEALEFCKRVIAAAEHPEQT